MTAFCLPPKLLHLDIVDHDGNERGDIRTIVAREFPD